MKKLGQIENFLVPLKSISASLYSIFKMCPFRGLLLQQKMPGLLPSSPAAILGSIAHKLLEEAGRGEVEATETDLCRRWYELIDDRDDLLRDSELEKHLAPLTNSLPDMDLVRIRTVRKALELARSDQVSRTLTRSRLRKRFKGNEIPVRSSDGMIVGVIDSVVEDEQGYVTIQEFKSGSILRSQKGVHPVIREEFIVQLKIYASLYNDTFGRWPSSLELVSLAGSIYRVPFSKNECTDLIMEIKELTLKINAALKKYTINDSVHFLAHPSRSACRFCEYRPLCGPYRQFHLTADDSRFYVDIIGTLNSLRTLGNGRLLLEVSSKNSVLMVRGISSATRHPVLNNLRKGTLIGIFNMVQSRPNAPLTESDRTTICNLDRIDSFYLTN